MNPTTTFLADILGKLSGVFCVAVFINFLIRKFSKQDTLKQKIFSIVFSVVLYIIIPTFFTNEGEPTENLLGWIFLTILCGLTVTIFFIFKIQLKLFLLIELWGILIFMIVGLPLFFVLGVFGFYSSLIGPGSFVLALIISIVLVLKQKLPWTKSRELKN